MGQARDVFLTGAIARVSTAHKCTIMGTEVGSSSPIVSLPWDLAADHWILHEQSPGHKDIYSVREGTRASAGIMMLSALQNLLIINSDDKFPG
jgi:hypothetical protein